MYASDRMTILVLLYILVLIAFLLQFLYIQGQECRRKIIEKYEKGRENEKTHKQKI